MPCTQILKMYMMVDFGKFMVIKIDQGHEFKMSTLGPCDGHEDSSWLSLLIMKKTKGVMHFGEKVCHFNEVFC